MPIGNPLTNMVKGGSGNVAANTDYTLTLPNATTPGNAIVIIFGQWTATTGWVAGDFVGSDNKGNVYSTALVQQTYAQNRPLGVIWAYNIAGGATHQVRIRNTARAGYWCVIVCEVPGLDTAANPKDQHSSAEVNGGSTLTAPNVTTTFAEELLLCAGYISAGNSNYTAGSGYTKIDEVDNADGESLGAEYRTVSAIGTYNGVLTLSPGGDSAVILVTFKGVSGGAGPTFQPSWARQYPPVIGAGIL